MENMENLGWTLTHIGLSLVVLAILITIATQVARKILKKVIDNRERKRKKAEEERLLGILAQWDPTTLSIFYDIPSKSDVYYLDGAKTLRKYPLSTFCSFVFPDSDKPSFWIIETNSTPNHIPVSHSALVYNNPSKTHWYIAMMENAVKSEFGLEYGCHLRDQLGHIITIRAPKMDILYTSILLLAQSYESRNDIWLKMLQEEAVPVLLASKDSMGGSPAIESVRKLIEGGPEEFFKNPVSNLLFE